MPTPQNLPTEPRQAIEELTMILLYRNSRKTSGFNQRIKGSNPKDLLDIAF